MKRRFAFRDGKYRQIRVDESYFKGYVNGIVFTDEIRPMVVDIKGKETCIRDSGFEYIQIYPDKEKYVITVIFNEKGKLVEWYFDMAKEVGVENGIPYEDDLFLDMLIMPNGEKIVIDEEELKEARRVGQITDADVRLARRTLKKVDKLYAQDLPHLVELTNNLCKLVGSKMKVKGIAKR